jgi:hypothetical protein
MKITKLLLLLLTLSSLSILSCSDDDEDPQVISVNTGVQGAIDEFRSLIGGNNNGNTPGSQASGRREINWDGIPDEEAQPNGYISDFFNNPVKSQTRGIEFSTPGMALGVSADNDNPTNSLPSFGNINPQYATIFPPFSGERVFSPLGSNITDIRFYVPGTDEPAVVRGFGAVYIDVDLAESGAFEFFDKNDNSLGKYATRTLNEGHVFLGVYFDTPVVHRIRITYGNSELGPDDGGAIDVSVMDDFIFSEPQPF